MNNSQNITNIPNLDYLKNLKKLSSTFSNQTCVNLDNVKSAFQGKVCEYEQKNNMGCTCTTMHKVTSRESLNNFQDVSNLKAGNKSILRCPLNSTDEIEVGEEASEFELTPSQRNEKNEKEKRQNASSEQEKLERDAYEQEQKYILGEYLNNAIQSRWNKMKIEIENWINTNFNWNNYRTGMYDLTVDKTWDDYEIPTQNPGELRQEFSTQLDTKFEVHYMKNITKIVNEIKKFESQIVMRLQSSENLEEKSLVDIIPCGYDIITDAIENTAIRSIFQSVRKRLLNTSKDFIREFSNNESILREDVKTKITSHYNEKMTNFILNGPHSREVFSSMRENLFTELTNVYVDVLAFPSGKPGKDVLKKCDELKVSMEAELPSYEALHVLKIDQFHIRTKEIISICQQTYTTGINEIASQYPNGTDYVFLETEHRRLQNEVCEILESDIRSKIGACEPVKGYRVELLYHMNNYFEKIVKATKEKFDKFNRETRDKSLHLDDSKKSLSDSNINSVLTAAKDEHQNKRHAALVFDFKNCTHLSMAVKQNNENTTLRNEFNEIETPAIVGYSYFDEKFSYGNQVTRFMRKWNLAHHLDKEYKNSSIVTCYGVPRKISFEFLLAFLLRKLKHTAEAQVGNIFFSSVIIIPFWFSSTHRVKMQDGAKLAGFSQVYLVHESSCAAFACIPKTTDGKLLVIAGNRHGVRAFHYNCCKTDRKVQMINYWKIHEIKYKNGVLDLVDGYSKVSKLLSSDYQNVKEAITKDIRKAIREMLDETNLVQVYVAENEEWKGLLHEIAHELPDRQIINSPNAVLSGALDLSSEVLSISKSIEDILSFEIFTRDLSVKPKVLNSFAYSTTSLSSKDHFIATRGWIEFLQRHELDEEVRVIEKVEVQTAYSNQMVKITTEISKEGIFKCKSCDPHCSSDEAKSLKMEEQPKVFSIFPNVPKKEFGGLAIWLDQILPPNSPEKLEIIQAKKQLLQLCLDMTNKIQLKELNIKSKLNKIEVLDQIAEAKTFAEHQNANVGDLKRQTEKLEKLYEYYSSKQKCSYT